MRAWLIAVSVMMASPASAEHGDPFMLVSPLPGTTIPTNARIRIESHNGIVTELEELGMKSKGYRAVLVAADHEIALEAVSFFEDHEGGYGAGLLVLAPKKPLHATTEYHLEIRRPGGARADFVLPWSWTTASKADRRAPAWTSAPTVGTAPNTLVADPGAETPIVEIVADLTPVKKGTAKRLPLLFDLGRSCGTGPTVDYTEAIARTTCPDLEAEGLCQQVFLYDADADIGRDFSVKLTAVDLAGNRAVAPGPRPRITWGDDKSLRVCLPVGTP